jgi:hypothetical protein
LRAPKHIVDPALARKRDIRGLGQTSQITAEQDDGMVEHVYQTASGEERTEWIPASEATMVPSEGNTPIVVPPREEAG